MSWCSFLFFFLFFSPLRCLPLYFLLFFFSFSSVLFLLMLPALNVHRDVENLHRFAKEVHKQKTSICVFMCVCVCEEINKQTKKAKHSFFFFLVTGRVAVMRRIWTGASVKTKKKNSVFNERTQAKLMRKKKTCDRLRLLPCLVQDVLTWTVGFFLLCCCYEYVELANHWFFSSWRRHRKQPRGINQNQPLYFDARNHHRTSSTVECLFFIGFFLLLLWLFIHP